jgi:hypothetical protein
MIIEKVEEICANSKKTRTEITIAISRSESQKLKEALELIGKYKKAALEAIPTKQGSPLESDWLMHEYDISSNKVIVSITDGSYR